jgi:hypothetical protein
MILESKKMFVDDFDGEIIVNSEYELKIGRAHV